MKNQIYAFLGKESLQPLYDRLIGYLFRLKGYSNFPTQGGDLDLSGEGWFISNFLTGKGGVYIDVGANKGEYTLELLDKTKGYVYSIEPLPRELETLRFRTKNYTERCTIVPSAISNTLGTQIIRFNKSATETASLSREIADLAYDYDNEIVVDVTTIDSLVEKYNISDLEFIKIDVEGMEIPCLEGARETIINIRPRFIQIEFHWHHLFTSTTVRSIHKHLPGYTGYRLLPSGLCRINSNSTLDNIYAYSNIIFSREEL